MKAHTPVCLACALLCGLCPAWSMDLMLTRALTKENGCELCPASSMDLMQAYQSALSQDASLRAARAAAQAGQERLPQARAALLPNVSASLSGSTNKLDSTSPDTFGVSRSTSNEYVSTNQTLTLRQTLYRPFQTAQYRQAQAKVDEADATLARELQNLSTRLGGAYFEALLAQDQLALVQGQKATYTVQLDASRKALAAGSGTRTDIDEAQARLDMALAQELEARQNVDYTRRQLEALVNQPVAQLATLNAKQLQLRSPEPNQVAHWAERAEQHSPEIAALQAQLAAASEEINKATANHYPTLDAQAQMARSRSENVLNVNSRTHIWSIGLQLNVPIYAGGYVDSLVRQALAEQERIAQTLEALKRDLAVRVHKEFRGVTEGIARVQALEQAVRSAEQLVQSNRRSFQAGSRTLVDVFNAEQQRMVALRDLAQARYLHLLSRIRLQALVGDDATLTLQEINSWLSNAG